MHSPLQINDFRWKEVGLWLIKVLVLGLSVYYIYKALSGIEPWRLTISVSVFQSSWKVALLVLLLVPANWWLEIRKWKCCVKPLGQTTTQWATWSVLRGLSLNWVIPFTLGEFIGRSLGLPKTKSTIRVNLVNRFVSMWVTLAAGIVAGVFFWPEYRYVTLAAFLVVLAILIWAIHWDQVYVLRDKLTIVLLAVLRYLVFSFQLGVLLHHFCPDIPYVLLLTGIPVVFFVRTIAPSLLGALGVREAAILWVFLPFAEEAGNLLAASLFLWAINIVLPSLVGLIPVLGYRIKLTA